MAISGSNVASVASGANASSYSTASYTPTANRLMLASVVNEKAVTTTVPTFSGNGLSWAQITTYEYDSSGTGYRLTLFAALSGSSPSAGAATADFGGVTQLGAAVAVDEYDGADISGTAAAAIVQTVNGGVNSSGTSQSITLAALANASNATGGLFGHEASEVHTVGSGYTLLADLNHNGPADSLGTEYKATGSTTVDMSWTTSAIRGGIAWEMKVVAAVVATPGTLALTLSTFAPTVTASNHQTVTPGVLALVTTTFAPDVVVNTIATPGVLALTTTTFAPTVSVSDNKTATPGVTALALTTFAPSVSVSDNKIVTPGVTDLVTSTFAPTVTASDHQTVTPGVTSLSLATFAPTVSVSDNKVATPGVLALVTATFAPTVSVSSNQVATPGVVALSLSTFAPTVTASDHKTATPDTLGLTLSTFAPTVTASDHKTVTPDVVALTLTSFAPTVTVGSAGNVTVTPDVLALTLVTFAPTVTATSIPPRSVEGDRGLRTTLTGRAPRRHVPFEPARQFPSEWAQDDEDVLLLLLLAG